MSPNRPGTVATTVVSVAALIGVGGGIVAAKIGDNGTPGSRAGGSTSNLKVVDLTTGTPAGSVAVDLLLDATWADSEHLLIQSATDNAYSAFTISECTVDGSCEELTGARAESPARDAATGWTY